MRIQLADDHEAFRHRMRVFLEASAQLVIVAEAEDGEVAVRLAAETQPDVIIMDVVMPRMSGPEATRRILAAQPVIKVIALSLHAHQVFVRAMLDAGASGYVLKDSAFDELPDALRHVAAGQIYLSPHLDLAQGNDGD